MIFAAILAGGIGSRMSSEEKPKQFLLLKDKPIIIHTLEKFLCVNEFEEILLLCPSQWHDYTKQLIEQHIQQCSRVKILSGGNTRNDTILNAVLYIEEKYGLKNDTLLVTHDAVRPFVSRRIIEDNIKAASKHTVCDTVIPATDTVVVSQNGETLSDIPDRTKIFLGQTPQSFIAKSFKELYLSLSEEEKNILTDAAKIFVIKGFPVAMVQGDVSNIKVTYSHDLAVARMLAENKAE